MKKAICMLLILLFALVMRLTADEPIGVFVNNPTNCIQFINPLTQELSPSLLKGQLGSYDWSLLVKVLLTSDGKKALVLNAELGMLYIIDISGGFSVVPTILAEVNLETYAMDMVLTPDDQYVIFIGGGFQSRTSGSNSLLSTGMARQAFGLKTVNLATFEVSGPQLKQVSGFALEMTPDGKTILLINGIENILYSVGFDSEIGAFTLKDMLYLPVENGQNLEISPDGKMVLVNFAGSYKLGVVTIYGDSKLHLKELVQLPNRNGQTVVFSKDGTKAYCLTSGILIPADQPSQKADKSGIAANSPYQIIMLNISPEGAVTVADMIPLSIPRDLAILGSDCLAIDPSGNYLYVCNPFFVGGVVEITVVDLVTNTEVNQLRANGLPMSVCFGIINE